MRRSADKADDEGDHEPNEDWTAYLGEEGWCAGKREANDGNVLRNTRQLKDALVTGRHIRLKGECGCRRCRHPFVDLADAARRDGMGG